MVCLGLLGAGIAVSGLSWTAWDRDSSQWSVLDCLGQGWQSVVCLGLLGTGIAVSGLSWTAWGRDGSLRSVFGYIEQR